MINETTIKKTLARIVKSSDSVATRLQECLVFAFIHYDNHGDSQYLTACMNTAIAARGIPAKVVQAYIMRHSDLFWTKKKGSGLFKKRPDMKGIEFTFTLPDHPWDSDPENKKNDAQADWQIDKYAGTVFRMVQKHDGSLDDLIKELRSLESKAKLRNKEIVVNPGPRQVA
jgi:hypothetical protein